jgi:hypothetical protein
MKGNTGRKIKEIKAQRHKDRKEVLKTVGRYKRKKESI